MTRLAGCAGGLLLLGLLSVLPLSAGQSVTLAWSPSSDTNVVGYRIYYGAASRTYTNMIDVRNKVSVTISNLMEGATYYFAATSYNLLGMESIFSDEIAYTVPIARTNHTPTLNTISDLAVGENAGLQAISLTGISSGASNEIQTLTVRAVSSNPALIPAPAIAYTSPNRNGTLVFKPAATGTGSAVITVMVNDGGTSNNVVVRSFVVTVDRKPRLQIRAPSSRQVVLTVKGVAGRTYAIEATQDFVVWKVIGAVKLGADGSAEFADSEAVRYPNRFYRVRETTPLGIRVTPARQVILTVAGPAGRAYEIQATRDFTNWTVLGTVTLGAGGLAEFADPEAGRYATRFYRLREIAALQIRVTPARQVVLTVTGPAGHGYQIQATRDFIKWTEKGVVTTDADGRAEFTDPEAVSGSGGFYRTREAL